ncbi:MAG: hypothetical protein SVX38_08760 [Chloroflexota bacterium]|nr:hypothetical protein [Chloroflexota bacterium]
MAVIRGIIFDLGHTLIHLDGDPEQIEAQGMADMADFLVEKGLALDRDVLGRHFLPAVRKDSPAPWRHGSRFWLPTPCVRR